MVGMGLFKRGVFSAGRHLSTLFEGYDDSTNQSRAKESNANLRAIGFVDRYRTHRLCLRTVGANTFATISPTLTPASTADPRKVATRAVWVAGAALLFARQFRQARLRGALLSVGE